MKRKDDKPHYLEAFVASIILGIIFELIFYASTGHSSIGGSEDYRIFCYIGGIALFTYLFGRPNN